MARICFKCGKNENEVIKMVTHHTSYNPEKTVDCCQSCHKKIHLRLRKLNLCPLSPKEARRLSGISSIKRNQKIFIWGTTLGRNVQVIEKIRYNINTGSVGVDSWFRGNGTGKVVLPVINGGD